MSELQVSREDAVMVVTLNRPDARNALTMDMADALASALKMASSDLAIRALVLTGAGGSFCSGADTRQIQHREGAFQGDSPPRTRHSYSLGIQELSRAFYACEVPTIAAVNGAAIGLGFDLTTHCDLRVADENATFSEAFVTMGLIPGDGGFWTLPRIVGYSRAIELTVTGRRIDAATAERWGLVSRVVPPGEAQSSAMALANEIATRAPHTVRLSKRLVRDAMDLSFEAALSLGALAQATLTGSIDQREAVAATIGRRAADFSAA